LKQKFLWMMLAAGLFISQSCSKNEYVPKPITTAAIDPIAHSTGLSLDNVGDFGIFEFLTTSGQVAETANNSKTIGGTGDVADYAATSFQKWKITKAAGGYFTLMNLGSGLYAQSYNYNGTQVLIQNIASVGDAQLWNLFPTGTKSYKAINKVSGLAITANGNGMIELEPYTGLSSQTWWYNELPGTDTLKATKFYVSTLLSSNMVVQRDKPLNIWGTATPNFTVSVKVSWNQGLFAAVADQSGNWLIDIPAAPANASPQTLTASVNGQLPVTFSNLLIGDVWVCAGQSNMQMTVDSTSAGLFYSGITNYKAEIAAANFPQIREYNVNADTKANPIDTLTYPSTWTVCSPSSVGP
jgi:sialate O-acetylesterase